MAKLCRYPLFVLLLTSFLQLTLANLATTVIGTVLQRTKQLNFVMSPQLLIESIYPIYLGASGQTRREISKFLKVEGKTKIQVLDAFEKNKARIAKNLAGALTMTTGLFGSENIELTDEYTSMIIDLLSTDYKTVDFRNPIAAAKVINEWVANNTDNRITHMIRRTPLGAKLMIFSALYYNGALSLPSPSTINATFNTELLDGVEANFTVNATISRAFLRFSFLKEINADLIAIPFTKGNMNLVILMPKDNSDIETIESNLHEITMAQLAPVRARLFELVLPHFSIQTTQNYKNIFEYLGITRLFKTSANLRPMETNKRQKILLHDLIQKTKFMMNGTHTEAASYRAANIKFKGLPTAHILKPFIFFVKDNFNIFLAGRIGYVRK
ncbi:antichymotrypsin-2 [Drosophila mojavensis]|uniref:Serpin domain-containing protein n=1 Tax=Drosophila mojavensis TaxID=7230 RepID=A0A0Q9XCY2_DROMO|nr:antichymotrypsin-2 [Drosophila mojavensis]KRG06447.1 uncharacterized protein Dmoj_GI26191 [Drosophila mojavensis]